MPQDHENSQYLKLQAFVDNEQEFYNEVECETLFEKDRSLKDMTMEYQQLNNEMQELSDFYEYQKIPEPLLRAALRLPTQESHQKTTRRKISWSWVLALLLGSMGGFLGSTSLQLVQHIPFSVPPVESQLLQPAMLAYATYAPEVKHPVEVDASQQAHLVAWLSKRLQTPLHAPELSSHGYKLVGGRLLPASQLAAAQFMYEDNHGQRLTLYIRKIEGVQENTSFSLSNVGEKKIFFWIDQNYGYAISGALSDDKLLSVGKIVYEEISVLQNNSQQSL